MAEKDFVVGSNIVADNIPVVETTSVTNENTEITLASFDKTLSNAAELTILATQGVENKRIFIKGVLMHDGTTASFQKTSTFSMNDVPSGTIGTAWNLQGAYFNANDTGSVRSIAFGNNLWVAGGGGYGGGAALRTSTDAITWTTRTPNLSIVGGAQGFADDAIQSVAFGNNLWVLSAGHRLRTSTDAITWTTRTSTLSAGNYAQFNSIVFGNNLWVAGGSDNLAGGGVIRTSTDAITWTTRNSNFGATNVETISYGNNLWIAGGYNATIRTSTDAITWVTRAAGTLEQRSYNFKSLSYNSDHGVWAASTNGAIFTSKNLSDWRQRDFYSFGTQPFAPGKIAYQNGMFVAIDGYGYVALSLDGGETWQSQNSGLGGIGNQSLYTIAYSATQLKWVIGGYGGVIKTSEGTPPTLKPISPQFFPKIDGSNVVLTAQIIGATSSPATVKVVKQVLY